MVFGLICLTSSTHTKCICKINKYMSHVIHNLPYKSNYQKTGNKFTQSEQCSFHLHLFIFLSQYRDIFEMSQKIRLCFFEFIQRNESIFYRGLKRSLNSQDYLLFSFLDRDVNCWLMSYNIISQDSKNIARFQRRTLFFKFTKNSLQTS